MMSDQADSDTVTTSEPSVGSSKQISVIANNEAPPKPPPRGRAKRNNRRTEWEILEGLKDGQRFDLEPRKFEGFVLKKRKWPLKGYHKRYFVLDKGIIVYGKSAWDCARGKIHGSVDAGMSVISTKLSGGRIDIDAEDCIYHLKIKPKEAYMEWVEQFKQHRLHRQNILLSRNIGVSPDDSVLPLSPMGLTGGEAENINKDINLVEKAVSNLEIILESIPQTKKEHDNHQLRDFIVVAKEVIASLKGIAESVMAGRSTREAEEGAAALRHALNQALQQNAELKSRLSRINRESSIELMYAGPSQCDTIKSYSGSLSNSEYYDALDNEDRTSSDEDSLSSEGEGEADSLNSEASESSKFVEQNNSDPGFLGDKSSNQHIPIPEPMLRENRRSVLPVPAPDGSDAPSLWGILRKNIGKDLSKISMPVALNEPLGVLQRMCEELEYSELLDAASKQNDPVERLALIAAFAVSGYSASFFRTHKPFNPLLGESFECTRDDKGFRFVAEQVSHHPPVSACHADGRGWQFWEETQLKTKFWGKSMEIQPIGQAHIIFPKWNEHYSYNKATTCVHNIFTPASRSVDLFGEVVINSDGLICKLTFVKASYWSSRKQEVFGTIVNQEGVTIRNLYGHWNEAFFIGQPPSSRCIWRMGVMPEEASRYYGFTRLAIELNELNPSIRDKIPPTDTRFRPDQRLLEEGDLNGAEQLKQQLEQAQRERRKKREEDHINYNPVWFTKLPADETTSEIQWKFAGKYWDVRKTSFKDVKFENLW